MHTVEGDPEMYVSYSAFSTPMGGMDMDLH